MRPLHVWLVVAALLALGWCAWEIRDLFVPLYGDGGGLGAVSAGFSEDVLTFLAVITVVAVNLALGRPARCAGLLATWLRRAHLYLTLSYVAMGLATTAFLMSATFERVASNVAIMTILLFTVLGATFVPVQAFFVFAAGAFTLERLWRSRKDTGRDAALG